MEARNDYVITKRIRPTKKVATTSFNVDNTPAQNKVISIGPGVENVKINDLVVYSGRNTITFEYEGELCDGTPEKDIVAKVGHSE